jgi:predicted NAD/FAD-binding protein
MVTVTTQIAGAVHYEGAQTKLNRLRDGTEIELVRVHDNGFDANAIACYKDEQMLGYIKMKDNKQAAAAMDRGETVRCAIHGYQPMVRLTWASMDLDEASRLRRIVRA